MKIFQPIGLDYKIKNIEYKNWKLQLTYADTPGQESNNSLILNNIRSCHIVLLVFDNLENLEELKSRWLVFI